LRVYTLKLDVPATYVSVIKTKMAKGEGNATTTVRRKTAKHVEASNGHPSIVSFVRVAKMLGKSEAIALIKEL
jgi:hypothetical protein